MPEIEENKVIFQRVTFISLLFNIYSNYEINFEFQAQENISDTVQKVDEKRPEEKSKDEIIEGKVQEVMMK